jgi:cardiolipin synthase A/B
MGAMPTHSTITAATTPGVDPNATPLLGRGRTWPGIWFSGGNVVALHQGGDQLFPAMHRALAQAKRSVWMASYIFHDDPCAQAMAQACVQAAARGVAVHLVVDGFGSNRSLVNVKRWFAGSDVKLVVYRPLDRWYAWLQPGQLRRLHQKLCSVDSEVAFVGGINIIDDRRDMNVGVTDEPRLDFAVELRGPVVRDIQATAKALWARASLGADWREELSDLARSSEPWMRSRALLQRMRMPMRVRWPLPPQDAGLTLSPLPAVRAAFVVRDNVRLRRAIERSYIDAIAQATQRIDLMSPYFYPGRQFRQALIQAAKRGVRVRLVLQGKVDYRIAALAARALYDELLSHGIGIHEYMPAFLHAKVAVIDNNWSTVGSSNIDPLSLLLNLEANIVVDDDAFAEQLRSAIDAAVAVSHEVTAPTLVAGWRAALRRSLVASVAHWYLRLAGVSGRY